MFRKLLVSNSAVRAPAPEGVGGARQQRPKRRVQTQPSTMRKLSAQGRRRGRHTRYNFRRCSVQGHEKPMRSRIDAAGQAPMGTQGQVYMGPINKKSLQDEASMRKTGTKAANASLPSACSFDVACREVPLVTRCYVEVQGFADPQHHSRTTSNMWLRSCVRQVSPIADMVWASVCTNNYRFHQPDFSELSHPSRSQSPRARPRRQRVYSMYDWRGWQDSDVEHVKQRGGQLP